MKSMLRVVSLVVVSFAAASAFAVDAPTPAAHAVQHPGTVQAVLKSGGPVADLVKCTNPRECSVGRA